MIKFLIRFGLGGIIGFLLFKTLTARDFVIGASYFALSLCALWITIIVYEKMDLYRGGDTPFGKDALKELESEKSFKVPLNELIGNAVSQDKCPHKLLRFTSLNDNTGETRMFGWCKKCEKSLSNYHFPPKNNGGV